MTALIAPMLLYSLTIALFASRIGVTIDLPTRCTLTRMEAMLLIFTVTYIMKEDHFRLRRQTLRPGMNIDYSLNQVFGKLRLCKLGELLRQGVGGSHTLKKEYRVM